MDKWDDFPGLLPQIKSNLRTIESVFGSVSEAELFDKDVPQKEDALMAWQEEQDDVILTEAVLPQKDVQLRIDVAEPTTWTIKSVANGGAPGHEGEPYPAMKLTLAIADPSSVKTAHENARPRLTIEHQMNLARYPYTDKKTGEVKWLGRQSLYDLEEAFGFDPVFTNGEGKAVEPFITRTGRKVAHKGEGIKRSLNPAFTQAYFTTDGNPNLEWGGKIVYADLDIEESVQFGDRNRITRFKRAPVSI